MTGFTGLYNILFIKKLVAIIDQIDLRNKWNIL